MSDNHDSIGLLSAVMQYWREEQDPDLWHACQDALEQAMLNESPEDERDELRAEVERLRAQNNELKESRQRYMDLATGVTQFEFIEKDAEIIEKDAEIKRLRAASANCEQHKHFSGGCPCNCHD